ncbi:predicted protein [Naegleria gruberi]|uniref:Predicted protein n=1 Tax=Naegleria gruberi TaxID=5762 RepID=D2V3D2_NAEGR|nr:uncharacterized protein NAEGRDRAFT_63316 [Naegleria gruberi]EFC48617.1 predicted protein [Naegleria gruberi]|eukprot:XP_002681361.1 predicted protein [Naegleria gruberi strain NEG-M]
MVKSPFNKTFPVTVFYLPKLDLIFVGYDNGCIVIFDGKSREKKSIIRGCHHIKKIQVIYNNKLDKHLLVAACNQGEKSHLLFWKITKNSNHNVDYSSTDLKQFEFNSQISDLYTTDIFIESINKENRVLICPLMDDSFKLLYNLFEHEIVELHFNKDHLNMNGGISSMSFDQDKEGINDLALSGMLNGKFQVYNLSNGTLQKTIKAEKHNSIECIAFDGALMNVCIGGSEGNVSIYNIENQEPILVKCIENCHDGFITAIAQCENFFTTGSQDGTIKVLDKVS